MKCFCYLSVRVCRSTLRPALCADGEHPGEFWMVTVSRWLDLCSCWRAAKSVAESGQWALACRSTPSLIWGGLSKQKEKHSHPLPHIGFYTKTGAELRDLSHPHKGTWTPSAIYEIWSLTAETTVGWSCAGPIAVVSRVHGGETRAAVITYMHVWKNDLAGEMFLLRFGTMQGSEAKCAGRSQAVVAGAFREMKQNNVKQWKSGKTGRHEVRP